MWEPDRWVEVLLLKVEVLEPVHLYPTGASENNLKPTGPLVPYIPIINYTFFVVLANFYHQPCPAWPRDLTHFPNVGLSDSATVSSGGLLRPCTFPSSLVHASWPCSENITSQIRAACLSRVAEGETCGANVTMVTAWPTATASGPLPQTCNASEK